MNCKCQEIAEKGKKDIENSLTIPFAVHESATARASIIAVSVSFLTELLFVFSAIIILLSHILNKSKSTPKILGVLKIPNHISPSILMLGSKGIISARDSNPQHPWLIKLGNKEQSEPWFKLADLPLLYVKNTRNT